MERIHTAIENYRANKTDITLLSSIAFDIHKGKLTLEQCKAEIETQSDTDTAEALSKTIINSFAGNYQIFAKPLNQ